MIFNLSSPSGTTTELDIPDRVLADAGGLRALNNREVVVTVKTSGTTVPIRVTSIRLALK
jgi:hypothetical protein